MPHAGSFEACVAEAEGMHMTRRPGRDAALVEHRSAAEAVEDERAAGPGFGPGRQCGDGASGEPDARRAAPLLQ